MKKLLVFLAAILLVFAVVGSANANLITNGDFETGDLMGWTSVGAVDVVNLSTPSLPGWAASAQGMDDYFALLGWGTGSGTSSLSQEFKVSKATSLTLAFDYAFDFLDFNPWNDDTFVALTSVTGDRVATVTMLDLQSSCIGADYGHYEETFALNPAWALDADMSFTLHEVGGLFSGGTLALAGIDNVSATTAPVPEPATMLLLGSGLIGLAGLGRKKFFKKS